MTNSFSGKAYGVPLQSLLVSAADAVDAVAPTCLDLLLPISQLLGGSQSDDLGSSSCLPSRARACTQARARWALAVCPARLRIRAYSLVLLTKRSVLYD